MTVVSDFERLMGEDANGAAMLLSISVAAQNLPDGDLKTGMILAVESGACFLDGKARDGGTQMLTLMEQVVGLLEGSYALVEIGDTTEAQG